MKYSISESARIIGHTRTTLYKHIKKKGISIEKDEDGKPLIDHSELIRVYGDKCRFDHNQKKSSIDSQEDKAIHNTTLGSSEHVELEKKLGVMEERLVSMEEQRNHWKELYEKEYTERRANMNLLTDQREREQKWDVLFEELRQQVEKSEQGAKKEIDAIKERAEKQMRMYRKVLLEEKNKSLWRRLIGG